ncbi:MAG: HD domain-containing protein [Chloroflexi bacterium]|nr:HD domain-containing protein [Chloroflexota bacterium]
MTAEERIEQVIAFAKKKRDIALVENPDYAARLKYRWQHTLRVVQYGKKLAKREGANAEIVIVACLLHDIAKLSDRSRNVEHGRIGAKMARPFLQELGYAETDVENICYAIASHVDGKADFEHPLTIEAQVVSDADKIDRLSSYRMMLALGKFADSEYESFIAKTKKRLSKSQKASKEWRVQTKSGKEVFQQQISAQVLFLERLIADHEMTLSMEF